MNTFFILIFNILASSQAVPDTTASDPIVAHGKGSFRIQLAKFFLQLLQTAFGPLLQFMGPIWVAIWVKLLIS